MDNVDYKNILAAVDFSQWSGHVLVVAAAVAERYGGAVTAVYAETFEPPPYFTERDIPEMAAGLSRQRQAAAAALRELVARQLGEESGSRARVVEARPVDGILRAAEELPAHLVVMGTHGRGGVNRLLLGSVTERLVRESGAPVLTVRLVTDGSGHGRLPFERVLCPVNGTPAAATAAVHAATLAARFGAELTLLSCLEDGDDAVDVQQLLDGLAADHRPTGVRIHTAVRRGPAAEQILRAAREDDSDLIVVAAQRRSLLESTIVGVTGVRVMRHAACPVLTVIPPED